MRAGFSNGAMSEQNPEGQELARKQQRVEGVEMEAMDVENSEEFQKGLVFGTTIKQSKCILYKYTTDNVCPRKRH